MAKTFDEICSEILKEMTNGGQPTTVTPDLSTNPQNSGQKNPSAPNPAAPQQPGSPNQQGSTNPQTNSANPQTNSTNQQNTQQQNSTQPPKVAYTSTKNNTDVNALLQQMQQMAQNNDEFKKQMLQALGVK